jgi:hypothetical protein
MADRGKDNDTKPVFDSDLPVDEEMDEESTEDAELEGDEVEAGSDGDELEAGEGDENESNGEGGKAKKALTSAGGAGAFHFSLGRGQKATGEGGKHQGGSVRTSHERVHVDDRLSAIYVLVAVGGLIGILVLAWGGGMLPKNSGPTLAPLVVPTGKPTPTACITPTPVATATPTLAASASASAKPTPTLAPSVAASASASAAAVASASAASAAVQAAAVASANASAAASFCAIPVATPTPTAAPSSSASAAASPSPSPSK